MNDCFFKQFEAACFESCSAYFVEQQRQNEQYEQADRKYSELLRAIEQKLGEDGELASRLEETVNQRAAISDLWLHRKGALDCVCLLRWMGILA